MTEKNTLILAPITRKKMKLVPPDGGWGWFILVGVATCNIFNQSLFSLFGLLYGDALEDMGYRTQGAAVVLGTMLFVTNLGGPIAGVLLKLTSPRFTAVTGTSLCAVGIFLSGFSTNIYHLIFSFGIVLGLGLGFIQNSSFVAINSYFNLRKGRAVGLANVGTGVGQSLMPHLTRYLLEKYGFQGACLILSGLSLHGIAGTLLIQPVSWHMKKIEDKDYDENTNLLDSKHKDIVIRVKRESITNNESSTKKERRASEPPLFSEIADYNINGSTNCVKPSNDDINNNSGSLPKKGLWKKMYDLLDISLLSSPRFLNIIIGTALCMSSIQNFSMLYPFFLQKSAMMNKQQTATCMSAVAVADICGRLILPTFQDKFRIKARWMLIMTSAWIMVVRQILAYQVDLTILIIMSGLYGFGRSMTVVGRNIAISEHCRIEQVPAAVGLGMLTMGLIVPPACYVLGWVRDYSGSYITCITVQNLILLFFIATWLPDMYLLRREEIRKKKSNGWDLQMTQNEK